VAQVEKRNNFTENNNFKNNMTKQFNYNQRMDIKYDHQELIDVNKVVEECTDKWFNQTLSKVNSSVVRIGIVEGEYHWHKHDNDDEFFFVLSGKLLIDLEDKTLELNPNEGATISKGVMHKTRAPHKTVMLMVETDTIDPIGQLK
jgi:mannose-6-phosphate isomerase-like protein (cupin superfamily)